MPFFSLLMASVSSCASIINIFWKLMLMVSGGIGSGLLRVIARFRRHSRHAAQREQDTAIILTTLVNLQKRLEAHEDSLGRQHSELTRRQHYLDRKHNDLNRKHNDLDQKHNDLNRKQNGLDKKHHALDEKHRELFCQQRLLRTQYKDQQDWNDTAGSDISELKT
ncbi:hypothetical protein LEL_02461 [Akanthomyces lecanii RCEF 1005]|uniref:Uncharacterized protein n=1 Tax=Akanthomyces lecanii RCEF 1005 TaxID=1081108 RepID=A0A162IW58_CORDF|nr:hypothetical protein LEL_02461 [Akanthomyces lecanii RCEF 1005]